MTARVLERPATGIASFFVKSWVYTFRLADFEFKPDDRPKPPVDPWASLPGNTVVEHVMPLPKGEGDRILRVNYTGPGISDAHFSGFRVTAAGHTVGPIRRNWRKEFFRLPGDPAKAKLPEILVAGGTPGPIPKEYLWAQVQPGDVLATTGSSFVVYTGPGATEGQFSGYGSDPEGNPTDAPCDRFNAGWNKAAFVRIHKTGVNIQPYMEARRVGLEEELKQTQEALREAQGHDAGYRQAVRSLAFTLAHRLPGHWTAEQVIRTAYDEICRLRGIQQRHAELVAAFQTITNSTKE